MYVALLKIKTLLTLCPYIYTCVCVGGGWGVHNSKIVDYDIYMHMTYVGHLHTTVTGPAARSSF